jgi:hypothetical protein
MDRFLETYDHRKLNQEDNYLNILIKSKELEAAIVSQKRKVQNVMDSPVNFTRPL